MRPTFRFVILFLILILFNACKKSDDTPNIIVNVDDEFYVNLFEEINETERVFQITLKSIHDQDCQNYTIDNNFSLSNQFNRIILTINEITAPENCLNGYAPAYEVVPIADLKNEVYLFHINLTTAVKNEGRLTVSEDGYRLEMETDNGIVILNHRLYKIPEQSIWGYIAYENEDLQDQANQFIQELENLEGLEKTAALEQGYYGYFSVVQDQQIEIEQEIDHEFHQPFFYHFSGENTDLTDLIDGFCAGNPGLKIQISDTGGLEMSCD